MKSVMKKIIFHVDINSYFATMLQQENPSLRGKIVGVVKGVGRSCIIASSNEAKKVGIKTGCVVKDAKKIAPGIVLVPANFDIMLSATRKLKNLFQEFDVPIIFEVLNFQLQLPNLQYDYLKNEFFLFQDLVL